MKKLTLVLALSMLCACGASWALGGYLLGDTVWFDTNQDGVQQAGEDGIPGVGLKLTGALDPNTYLPVTLYATTDAAGHYEFDVTDEPATFTVEVVSGLPENAVQTYDTDSGLGPFAAGNATVAKYLFDSDYDVAVTTNFDFGYYIPTDIEEFGEFATFTQGGWGAPPSGENPGALLHANFPTLYPGGLVIGGTYVNGVRVSGYTLTFRDDQSTGKSGAQAITDFLPQGSTAGVLKNNYINPKKKTEAGVLAGQVVAMTLNVHFSAAGITQSGLGGLKITSGTYVGWTVNQLLALGWQVLGGNTSGLVGSISSLNDACTAVNENYDGGTTDKGFLAP